MKEKVEKIQAQLEAEKKVLVKRNAREQAFLLTFERTFSKDEKIEDVIEAAELARDLELDPLARKLFCGVDENITAIDKIIEKNIKKWKMNRISRVSITLIRMATYEMIFLKECAISISINEAVILAKKFGADKDSSFINGVLGGIARNEITSDKE